MWAHRLVCILCPFSEKSPVVLAAAWGTANMVTVHVHAVNSLPTNDAYMRHEIFVRERPMTHIRVMANAYTYSDAVAARSTLGLPLPD